MTRTIPSLRSAFSAVLLLGAFAVGCGSEDDDPETMQQPNDSSIPDGSTPSGQPFNGVVVESTNVSRKLPSIPVRLFDVQTGEILADIPEQVSDANGSVTFASRPANAGLFVKGGGLYQDTWNFPPARKGEEMLVRLGTTAAAAFVPGATGYVADQSASPLAGSVLWKNPATQQDEFVGCATVVESAAVKDVRYFTGQLPASLAARSPQQGTQPAKGGDGPARPENENEAGKFFIGNLAAGEQTIEVQIRGQKAGSARFFIKARSTGTPITIENAQVPSNLTLGSIWVQGATNPTPADCK